MDSNIITWFYIFISLSPICTDAIQRTLHLLLNPKWVEKNLKTLSKFPRKILSKLRYFGVGIFKKLRKKR